MIHMNYQVLFAPEIKKNIPNLLSVAYVLNLIGVSFQCSQQPKYCLGHKTGINSVIKHFPSLSINKPIHGSTVHTQVDDSLRGQLLPRM